LASKYFHTLWKYSLFTYRVNKMWTWLREIFWFITWKKVINQQFDLLRSLNKKLKANKNHNLINTSFLKNFQIFLKNLIVITYSFNTTISIIIINSKKIYLKPGGMFPLLSKLKNISIGFKIYKYNIIS
jgi:hypothetical protein